jgi:hypothetical protein
MLTRDRNWRDEALAGPSQRFVAGLFTSTLLTSSESDP